MKYWFFLVLVPFILNACSHCNEVPSLYVSGQALMEVDSRGALVKTKERRPLRKYSLAKRGQFFDVPANQPFELDVQNGIDMSIYSLTVEKKDTVTPGPTWYRVSLEESCTPFVKIEDSCEIINWYNPYRIPEIRTSPSKKQIVLTPLLRDNTSEVIGFEIRLGNANSPCTPKNEKAPCCSPALDRLTRLGDGVRLSFLRSNTKDDPYNPAILLGGRLE